MSKYVFYRLTCLTNLHMGSGDNNYGIIDLQVEKDPVLMQATMNSTGVKGALRDACKAAEGIDDDITYIFGSENNGDSQGNYSFFTGDLMVRPLRADGGSCAYVLAASVGMVKNLIEKLTAFGFPVANEPDIITALGTVNGNNFLTGDGAKYSYIEDFPVTLNSNVSVSNFMETIIGSNNWAILPDDKLKTIDLPVFAHNVLKDKVSKNLWYEEVVPHHSQFGLIIKVDGDNNKLEGESTILGKSPVVQFGAGASTGYGYVKMEEITFNGGNAEGAGNEQE